MPICRSKQTDAASNPSDKPQPFVVSHASRQLVELVFLQNVCSLCRLLMLQTASKITSATQAEEKQYSIFNFQDQEESFRTDSIWTR